VRYWFAHDFLRRALSGEIHKGKKMHVCCCCYSQQLCLKRAVETCDNSTDNHDSLVSPYSSYMLPLRLTQCDIAPGAGVTNSSRLLVRRLLSNRGYC
jgi:hypothetical protein